MCSVYGFRVYEDEDSRGNIKSESAIIKLLLWILKILLFKNVKLVTKYRKLMKGAILMDLLFIILILVILLGIYDLIRHVNANLVKQTNELKTIREELSKNKISE
ncbi:hypothetical protein H9635_04960 [Solibacillus sp. A46]|uniref:Uncharacterized protein n=1 Tax=Solibacillus faecavium TaxID=2762221 RepID=A0ABR8XVU9_9BACL|nr:hypothetical protein [Solibacillus faecavium]